MTWNYRLVKKDGLIGIHSVYYNQKKEIQSLSVDPEYLSAETVDELKENVEKIMRAFERPVIDFKKDVGYKKPFGQIKQR